MEFLEVVDGAGRRRRVELQGPRLLIGREPSCDICLPHPGVSRRHAQLQKTEQGRWLLQDLSSLNHVFVDDKPIQQIILEASKPFQIAEYTLALEEEPTLAEVQAAEEDSSVVPGADSLPDPAWLERLHIFQRGLFRVEDAHDVMVRLAREYQFLLRSRFLAVGVTNGEEYVWDPVLCEEDDDDEHHLREAVRRLQSEESSSVQIWTSRETDASLSSDHSGMHDSVSLLIPMKGRTGIVGHIYVYGPQFQPVPSSMVHYLSVLAALSGLMWDNIQLAALRLVQLALERDLERARQIQIDLFPETFEIDPRLDVFAVNLPSARVSGDYYDLVRTGPNTVAFVIADAMGHGMSAALLMAAVRSALRMGLTMGLPWPAIFAGLDSVIARARSEVFVTGLVGHLDLATQELQLVCAGHPLPSILVDGKLAAIPETCRTRPWGVDIPVSWAAGQVSLRGKSWSILCYTDGITDAAARTQRSFGAQRISTFHGKRHRLSAEDLCQGLLSEVAVQPGPRSLEDDQTVLVLRSAR